MTQFTSDLPIRWGHTLLKANLFSIAKNKTTQRPNHTITALRLASNIVIDSEVSGAPGRWPPRAVGQRDRAAGSRDAGRAGAPGVSICWRVSLGRDRQQIN